MYKDYYTKESKTDVIDPEQEALGILKDFKKDSWLWLKDVVDLHVYPLPCVDMRLFDEFELARHMKAVGYKAFVPKRHYCCNADVAALVNKYVPGIRCIGNIVLNWCVGGLNPHAVDFAIFMGAKFIWMGNMHHGTLSNEPFRSEYGWQNRPPDHYTKVRPLKNWEVAPPINAIDLDSGQVIPEVKYIIELCREAEDVVLNSCHISTKECIAVAEECERQDFHKFVIDHSQMRVGVSSLWDEESNLEDLKKLIDLGAYLEFDTPKVEPHHKKIAAIIKEVGPENCVITSGHGAATHVHPIEAMRWMMMSLRQSGITRQEVDMMTKITPSKLLELDEDPRWENRPFI
jgi:hypothetical protein